MPILISKVINSSIIVLWLLAVIDTRAAALVWDANGGIAPNPFDGSGAWLTANNWWNGVNNVNGTWTGSTPDGAAFGAGGAGNYTVALGTVNVSNITFNTSGYNLSGGSLTLSTPAANGTNLLVTNNVNATINSPIVQGSAATWSIATGATLTLGGGGFSSGGNFVWKGGGTIAITNGIYAPGGVLWLQNITNNQSGGTINLSSDALLGYAGNTAYTLSGGSSLTVGGKLVIGRGGSTGTVNLQNGIISANGSNVPGQPTVGIGFDGGSVGNLNISGGTFNVAAGKVLYLNYGATSSNGKGSLNLSGGTLNTPVIQFGNGSNAYNANSFANLNISGGTLNVGAGGLALNAGGFVPGHNNIVLSGGILAATADWTSPLPITLTNYNGNITFQAANPANAPFDISLSGTLAGLGGFIKTGDGVLTLSAANNYSGSTMINAGTVLVTGNGSLGGSSGYTINSNSVFILMNTAETNNTNRLNNAAPITMNTGAFEFLNDDSAANFVEAAGTLTINSGVNQVMVFPATNNQTSTLTFNSIAGSNGGSVDFQMAAAGTAQNRVFFTTPPTLGSWLTVNGDPAAYDAINGLRSMATYNDITALGSNITNAPINNVRINSAGSGGNIQLISTTTTINSLQQNTTTAAVIESAHKTLCLNQIKVNAGAQSLTVGAAPGDGVLMAGSMGGNLMLDNDGSRPPGLIINSALADNLLSSSLTISGGGSIKLAAPNNTYSGGTTIGNGTLIITTGTSATMFYTNIGGTLKVKVGAAATTLPMKGFTLGGNNPQLMFDFAGAANVSAPLISIAGNLELNGNVRVNVTNPIPGTSVLLQYGGARSGAGRFLTGKVPLGAAVIDNPSSRQVYLVYFSGPTVIVPPHATNEIIVAEATPQAFGAMGDGVTDDTAAFQNAVNSVYNSGGVGGGVVYVPAGTYVFSNNLAIPPGVTLQGDWLDWSLDTNGVTGTIFEVCTGAGQSNDTPFIAMDRSALKGISIWYPNQNPANIVPYPYTISLNGDTVVQDVALINSYQGILADSAAKHIISRVIGSPLYVGIQVDEQYDISQQEDVRFSPDFWPASQLPGAPSMGGPHAAWMRAHGVAEWLYRADGEACMDVNISGYLIGIYGVIDANGTPAASFYQTTVSNCGTAYLDAAGGSNTGMEFTRCTLDGDTAVDRSTNLDASAYFHTCQLTGRQGIAIRQTGGSSSTMQFQNCNVSGTVKIDGGIANFVNSSFTVPAGSNHCVMASGAIYAGFTGCYFNPIRTISNAADARRLVIDGRRVSTSPLPLVDWADIQNDVLTRRPAKLDLFIVTTAVGDGIADDTTAIQNMLSAASANGGGIVYLPAGKYKLTATLDVPGGVELRGSYPSRHAANLYDGHVKVTVLQPYAGAGTTNGPPAIALEPDSGVVGLSITYELQGTNATPYPPAIQGRGANIYASGILCPNAYWYVDLNTYPCTNHFLQQVDGWALRNAFVIGNGSTGSIIECMANWSYWVDNSLSASQLGSTWQPPVQNFAEHNLEWFWLGDCTELMVKNFDYLCHTFMRCVSQNDQGPLVNGILTMCDAAVECFRFESASNSVINIVNPEWMVTLADYPDLTGYGVISTPAFQGVARFFNAPLWGGRLWDYVIQGGDVGFELTHMGYLSTYGSKVDGGALHLINGGFEGNTASSYSVPFNSTNAGMPGKISEIIGCYAWTGLNFTSANPNNPVFLWGNFGINKLVAQTPFAVTPPKFTMTPNLTAQMISFAWSNNMGAFNLYSTLNLAPPATWEIVTNLPAFNSNQWHVIDETTNANGRFYRLGQ